MKKLSSFIGLLALTGSALAQAPCDSVVQAEFHPVHLQGSTFTFANTSFALFPDQTVYYWSFGDGTSASGPQATHTYAQPGDYTTCLLEIHQPCSDSTCHQVHVEATANPCDSLSAAFSVSVQGQAATFSPAHPAAGVHFIWHFGDGEVGDGQHPTHVYGQNGTYHACVLAWAWNPQTQDTCYADHCEWVTIQGGGDADPCDSLSAAFSFSVQGAEAHFAASHPLPGDHFTWHFGDGATSDALDPVHLYADSGAYHVCLVVWALHPGTQDTCITYHCEWVHVAGQGGDNPCDQLNAGFSVGVQGAVVHFENDLVGSVFGYKWNFGDGTYTLGPNPVHTYPGPGTYHACLLMWAWNPNTQDTCFADHCEWVTIQGQGSPCDSLSANFSVGLQGMVATFTPFHPAPGVHYNWHFGDGATSDSQHPTHTYPQAGTYHACLLAWAYDPQTQDTCYAEHCTDVVVSGGNNPCDQLNANFIASVQGQVAHFQNDLNSNLYTYQWNFGDGTSGFGPNPIHTYGSPGTYHACLLMWTWNPDTQDTCFADHCVNVVINGGNNPCDQLNANFSASVQGAVVHFQNELNSNQYTYQWNFGDGTSGFGPNPVHTYGSPGTYHACLLMWTWNPDTQDTCFADHCEWVTIQGQGSPCDSLSANFAVSLQGMVATFTVSHLAPGVHYNWHFGDGSTSDSQHPTHTYPQAGTYHACLLAWAYDPQTQDTCYAEHCTDVVINGGNNPCDQLNANFSASVQGAVVHFQNDLNSNQYTYQWNFGDGTSGFGPNPVHTYGSPGTYHACLLMWTWNPDTQDTCYAEHCTDVVVSGGNNPCDQLNANFIASVQGQVAHFQNDLNSNQYTYQWNFGDGTSGFGPNPIHTYGSPGTYHACLLMWTWNPDTQDTCFADHCVNVAITGDTGNPCDGLNAGFTLQLNGNNATFANTYISGEATYSWTFGDGTTGDGYNPTHHYPGPGTYHPCLLVWAWNPQTQDTCAADHCAELVIQDGGDPCAALQNASFSHTGDGPTVHFLNTTPTPGLQTTVHWSFGDGENGVGQDANHVYDGGGQYVVCMTINAFVIGGNDSCSTTVCDTLSVLSTGLPELHAGSDLHLWPQPTDGLLTVEGAGLTGSVQLTVLDMAGRLVWQATQPAQGRATVDLGALPSGAYVLHVRTATVDRSLPVLRR